MIILGKWTNEEIAMKVQSEGLDYMIQHYLSADKIEDEWLAEKWKQCKQLLNEIQDYLNQFIDEDEW